jgi:FkbM family methyltransferase
MSGLKFYSQYGQDKFLYENFYKNKKDGFYVDIGAHDGITLSNTMLFEELGWDGVCIEPLPTVFEQLKNNRKCTVLNCALSDNSGYEEFLFLEGYTEMLSGLVKEYDPNHMLRINNELSIMGGKKNLISCKTELFENLNLPEKIDYISLDVEGAEMTILKTINFDKYSINIMTIEVNNSANEIDDFMTNNGFEKISSMGCDYIYKNKNFNI